MWPGGTNERTMWEDQERWQINLHKLLWLCNMWVKWMEPLSFKRLDDAKTLLTNFWQMAGSGGHLKAGGHMLKFKEGNGGPH